MLPELSHQFGLGNGYALDLVVRDGIHEELVAHDANKLAIVDFRYQHGVESFEDLAEVAREGSDITEMCV